LYAKLENTDPLGSKAYEPPSNKQSILAAAIDPVFSMKRSLRQIFGAEYMIPIAIIEEAKIRLNGLNVTRTRSIPSALVQTTKIRAWDFVIRPEGIGRFFPLVLSRSASTRSLRTYIPVIIKNVAGKVAR
jgi:hypothetical protein